LKIITLSIGIFLLNVIRRALFIVPSREGYRKNKFVVTQNNFAKARYKIQNATGSNRPGRPITTARSVFEYYLYFNSMGNHRFTVFSIFLFLFSFSLLYFAVHKAEYARACNLLAATESVEGSVIAPLSSAYTIGTPCRLDALHGSEKSDNTDTEIATTNVETPLHIGLVNDFFDFFPVTVETKEGPASLLHLRTTSRFDIFYNGSSGSSIVIPKGVLIFPEAKYEPQTDFPHLTRLETKFTSLEDQLQLSVNSLEDFGKQIEESTVQRLEEQFIGLEEQLKASLEGLDILSDQLKENTEQLSLFKISAHDTDSSANTTGRARTGEKGQRGKLAKIPQECWGKSPDYIVEYSSGAQTITNAEILKSILDLSISYRNLTTDSLIITGFADRSGSTEKNQKISEMRANYIMALFERLGLGRDRIFTFGMGENDSLLYPHRRVEIRSCAIK
ncbi:MAG: OmpA family protein, partial [Sneathiella sp.]